MLGPMSTAYQALSDVPNACQILPSVVTGGQPGAGDLQQFAEAGGGVVLDLRDPLQQPKGMPSPGERCWRAGPGPAHPR